MTHTGRRTPWRPPCAEPGRLRRRLLLPTDVHLDKLGKASRPRPSPTAPSPASTNSRPRPCSCSAARTPTSLRRPRASARPPRSRRRHLRVARGQRRPRLSARRGTKVRSGAVRAMRGVGAGVVCAGALKQLVRGDEGRRRHRHCQNSEAGVTFNAKKMFMDHRQRGARHR